MYAGCDKCGSRGMISEANHRSNSAIGASPIATRSAARTRSRPGGARLTKINPSDPAYAGSSTMLFLNAMATIISTTAAGRQNHPRRSRYATNRSDAHSESVRHGTVSNP